MDINIFKNNLYKKSLDKIRFYKRTLPYIGEMVSTEIMEFSEIGITVFLREYKKEAFMSYNESSSSSKKMKTIKKQLDKNKNNILNVQEVDYEKGFIDVSKRCVNEKEQNQYINLIDKYELVFKVLIKTLIWNSSVKTLEEITKFLEKTLWTIEPLEIKDILEKYNSNINIFKEKFNLEQSFNSLFIDNFKKALPPKKYEITITYNIKSYNIDAISQIKKSINNLLVKIKLPIQYKSGNEYISKIVLKSQNNEEFNKEYKALVRNIKKEIVNNEYDSEIKLVKSNYCLI